MINCANPLAQYLPHSTEIAEAIERVLSSGRYILGEEVASFEEEFAAYLGARSCIGCGSGTDALHLVLKALGIGAGDEVVVPSLTASPTIAAVLMAGATPVYADVEPGYLTLDPGAAELVCTERTRAIIAVHLYGQAADMEGLSSIARNRGLALVEDCAQSAGAEWHSKKLGTLGDAGCFSFFPTKNLGAIGDAGAVVCNDAEIGRRVRMLRQYGWDNDRVSQMPGINSRLDELQAAILRIKLRTVEADNARRIELAAAYGSGLRGLDVELPRLRDGALHVYHLYVLQTSRRDWLLNELAERGVNAGVHYPMPAHRMPAYRRTGACLPVTDEAVGRVLSLPLYPGLGDDELEHVVSLLREICA